MAAALRLQQFTRLFPVRRQLLREPSRFSSTTQSETGTKAKKVYTTLEKPVFQDPFKKPLPKGPVWVSWGFDETDYLKDRYAAHCVFFTFITLFGFGWGLYWAYYPDYRQLDWAQREAYLLIREREAKGLPLIDRNYIPEDQVKLPTDEELGDFEIII